MAKTGIFFLIVTVIQLEIYFKEANVLASESHSAASIVRFKELLRDLLDGYDVNVRPRLNQSFTVEVNTSFTLNSIVHFDTTGQSIDIMGYFVITWFDEVMRWDPNDYGETNYFQVSLKNIWYPRIEFSKADENKVLGDKEIGRAEVSHNGLVVWTHDGIFHTMCKVTVEYYPFDVQTCEFVYHAAGETIDTLFLNAPDVIPYFYHLENSEWRVEKSSAKVERHFNTNIIYITITIQRRAEFTIYTLFIPLATLALVNIFTFLVPIDSGEKGSLAITLFLAYGFFATITRDSLPHNSIQVSYYVVYVTTLLIFSVFSVICVILEAKIHYSFGACKFHICRIKSKKVEDSLSKTKNDDEPDTEPLVDMFLTWNDFLQKVDIVMFVLTFFTMTIYSIVLWTYVFQKSKI